MKGRSIKINQGHAWKEGGEHKNTMESQNEEEENIRSNEQSNSTINKSRNMFDQTMWDDLYA